MGTGAGVAWQSWLASARGAAVGAVVGVGAGVAVGAAVGVEGGVGARVGVGAAVGAGVGDGAGVLARTGEGVLVEVGAAVAVAVGDGCGVLVGWRAAVSTAGVGSTAVGAESCAHASDARQRPRTAATASSRFEGIIRCHAAGRRVPQGASSSIHPREVETGAVVWRLGFCYHPMCKTEGRLNGH